MKNILISYLTLCVFTFGYSQKNEIAKANINTISTLIKNNTDIIKIKPMISDDLLKNIDSSGYSLLSQAVRAKNIELVRFLLQKGADPNMQNTNFLQSTPLMQCTNYNLTDIAKLLIKHGADVNILDKQNDPAIHWSAYYGQVDMTKLFLDSGANPNLKSIHSDGVLHVALKEYRAEVVDLLMQYNVGVHQISEMNRDILNVLKYEQVDMIERHYSGFNPDLIDASGTPVLVKAATRGQFKVVKYLIDKGANINAMNPTGHTALNRAIYFNHNEIAEFLIGNGADVNKTDQRFVLPPILAAIRSNNLKMGKLLIANKIDINIKDGINGMTPIMWAVGYQNIDFIKLLLALKPDLSVVSKYDSTVYTLTNDETIIQLLKQQSN